MKKPLIKHIQKLFLRVNVTSDWYFKTLFSQIRNDHIDSFI